MKITFVMKNWAGMSGGVRSNAMLAYHLQKRGHEVLIISPKPSNKPISIRQRLQTLIRGHGSLLNKSQTESPHFEGLDVPRRFLAHQSPVINADLPDADVVIATWWETAEWVANLSPQKGTKVYLIRHHEVHDYLPQERAAATYLLPMHKITISKWLVNVMETQYGDDRVSLVPNSIDLKKYHAPFRKKQAIPTVGMMYSTKKWKGSDICLKAFSLASQVIPDLQLVAFGTSNPSPDLPLPSNSKYVRLPPQNTIKDLYARCDAWLFGSRIEGFGRPILEAMACRTPVIGTPAGAAPELLSKGGGLLVKPNDPEDMAKAIRYICTLSNREWENISNSAYLTASSYTWDDAAELCERALDRAINRQKCVDFF